MSVSRRIASARPRESFFLLVLLLYCVPLNAQRPPSTSNLPNSQQSALTVNVSVRDSRGMPLENAAMVRLYSTAETFNMRTATQEASTAVFHNVQQGEYEVEITCMGFKTTKEHVSVIGFGGAVHTYIYIEREEEAGTNHKPPSGIVLSPKLQNELEKGLEAMRRREYEKAKEHFLKATQIGPTSSDAAYLLGTAELGLQQKDLAEKEFEAALKIEPSHERALMGLGELDLQAGNNAGAIAALEKAYQANGASWRTHFLLAMAYAKSGQLAEGEKHAEKAVGLAQEKSAQAMYLLGEIQDAEKHREVARKTWQLIIECYPNDPVAVQAKQKLARTAERVTEVREVNSSESLPLPMVPTTALMPAAEQPWAPPDVDSREYIVANDAPCQVDEVLAQGMRRMKAQIGNFEKFAATERIEHQEIDRYGVPGPARTRSFSYIVFVHELKPDSLYLDEDRSAEHGDANFPTSLATTGLNGLGIGVLLRYYRNQLEFRCEGLVKVREQAAWQIHFEEKKNVKDSLRLWSKDGRIYNVPLRGKIWLSASTYDMVRVETDLKEPVENLELKRDHLLIDYGPVSFEGGTTTLWLPWSAEMYMEVHGRRYHHRHLLSDYLLFKVDTPNRINQPKEAPVVATQADSQEH